jgi:hypothetical protein
VIGGDVLEDVAAACADLGHRCLVIGHPSTQTGFTGDTLAVPYAPYHLVFPRAAAVVIHSGAGTTGEALRSGRPIIAVPFGYDQFALSWQVERLGVGGRGGSDRGARQVILQPARTAGQGPSRANGPRVAARAQDDSGLRAGVRTGPRLTASSPPSHSGPPRPSRAP